MLTENTNHMLAYANSEKDLGDTMTLMDAHSGKEYIITRINTGDTALESFLFSLGCYSGEPITVVSRKRNNCTVSIKDGRYNIDNALARAIMI